MTLKSEDFYDLVLIFTVSFFSFFITQNTNPFVVMFLSIFVYVLYTFCSCEAKPDFWENIIRGGVFYFLMWGIVSGVENFGWADSESLMKVYTPLLVVTVGLGHMASFHNVANLLNNSWTDKILQVLMLFGLGLSIYLGDVILICAMILGCHYRHQVSIQDFTGKKESKWQTLLFFGIATLYGVKSMTLPNMDFTMKLFSAIIAISTFANLLFYLIDRFKTAPSDA